MRRQHENVKSQHHASTFTSSCPAKRGRGTTLRSRVVEGASDSNLARPHAPSTTLRVVPLPPHFVRGRIKRNRSRDALTRPSFAHDHDDAKNRFASGNQRGKRSAERRMPTMSALRKQVYAVCATHLLRGCAPITPSSHACGGESGRGRARLSALTLAALATGYHPDGSAPEPGFPPTSRAGVLPAWPFCRRLSTLRAGRSFCRPTGDPEPPGTRVPSTSRCNILGKSTSCREKQ